MVYSAMYRPTTSTRTRITLFALILSLAFHRGLSEDLNTEAPHVCIIGAGIAAASTAHFLSQIPIPPRLTVFERTHRIGGRVRSFHVPGEAPIEAGASIIASTNEMMRYFTSHLGLAEKQPTSSSLGLWNGTAFVFRTSSSSARTYLSVLRRYRSSPLRMRRFVYDLLGSYKKLYPDSFHIAHLRSFPSVRNLLARADDLYSMTQSGFPESLAPLFNSRYIDEMVSAITRVNYNQEVSAMNALSGAVGLAGSGGGLWSVNGGNEQVLTGLLADSSARIVLNTSVVNLSKTTTPSGRTLYTLSTTTSDVAPDDPADTLAPTKRDRTAAQETAKIKCDAVVLAAPYELAGVTVPPELHSRLHVGRSFQTTVATFVRARLNVAVFGENPPRNVLTTGAVGADTRFTSLGMSKPRNDGKLPLWKVFSRSPLTPDVLAYLFEPGAKILRAFPWRAYPRFSPPERFADFDVDKGGAFFYTSPLESAGSAMEMSAVSGANAAALVRDRLGLLETIFDDDTKQEL